MKGSHNKSSTAYLLKCYIWLINTVARGPISRAEIDDKWARSSINDYKKDFIPESTFHRWRATIDLLFDIAIKCNSYGEYYIEEAASVRGADMHERLINLMSVNSLLQDSKELRDRILYEPIPSGEIFLAPILEALRDSCAIEITYQSFNKEQPSTFIVEPYCLKMFKQRWYLLAYSPGLEEKRIYSLDRIHAVEPTNQKYKLPNDFDAEIYFRQTYGVSGMEEAPQIVEIRIEAYQANYLRTLPIHSSQEEIKRDENYSVFRYNIVPTFEFMQELRKQGSSLEVLSPQWLRDEFSKEAENLYGLYKG